MQAMYSRDPKLARGLTEATTAVGNAIRNLAGNLQIGIIFLIS